MGMGHVKCFEPWGFNLIYILHCKPWTNCWYTLPDMMLVDEVGIVWF